MRDITMEMIHLYKIKGFDFMGYDITNKKDLSFHHLIVAHRYCKQQGLGEGYFIWNGAILNQSTSHNYLHLIERIDPEIFYRITSEMIDENIKGKLDIENLKAIKDLLLYFEKEHDHDRGRKGKLLVKREYTINRFSFLD